MVPSRWLRPALTLPVVAAGGRHGAGAGSRGAFLAAGAAAIAWFAWPEAERLVAWRRRRCADSAKRRHERLLKWAERRLAKAERARKRADRRPASERRARRAERLAARAKRDVGQAERARERRWPPSHDGHARMRLSDHIGTRDPDWGDGSQAA